MALRLCPFRRSTLLPRQIALFRHFPTQKSNKAPHSDVGRLETQLPQRRHIHCNRPLINQLRQLRPRYCSTGIRMASTSAATTMGRSWKDEPLPPVLPERTHEEAIELFNEIQATFPTSLGEDRWYLLLIAALTPHLPHLVPHLYTHLLTLPRFPTPQSRQHLIRRIRESLLKLTSLIGVCKPIEIIFAIAALERPEDRDFSFSRKDFQISPPFQERGKYWINKIYRHNMAGNDDKFVAHKDFGWVSYNITYGLYLSDFGVLDEVETEIVTLIGIMTQNLGKETGWHLRGARRVGMSAEEVEGLHCCCELVARFCRVRLDKVPRVADIEHEVPWPGMEEEELKKE